MVILPLGKRLKKKAHRAIALAQDILLMEIYNHFSGAIIHGGTAMWRCYGSNRFSEDVDVYLHPAAQEAALLEKFLAGLRAKGFVIEKFKRTDGSIFSKLSYFGVAVRFEVIFKKIKNPITKAFEMSDGTSILVNTLEPEELIIEKVSAYAARRKVRDLYDIFFLLKFVEDKTKIKGALAKLLVEFKKPVDERELKVLIISGSIPSTKGMLREIGRWAR